MDGDRNQPSIAIRDFPRALLLGQRFEALQVCLRGIRNCTNLRSCTWTRDGSLSTDILEALQHLPHLKELEINGHNERQYDADILRQFTRLEKISIIMPHSPVIGVLPSWTHVTSATLRNLSLICKASPLVNDTLLAELAPNLVHLEHLYLVGCPKVTYNGLWSLLSINTVGLLSLGIEGLHHGFDIEEFGRLCHDNGALHRLQSITLTVDMSSTIWINQVTHLLSLSPLEMFHISTSSEVKGKVGDEFYASIVSSHGDRLRRFSVSRLRMSLRAIRDICIRCPKLEQLFVVVEQHDLEELAFCLKHARSLRSLHINRPLELQSDQAPIFPRETILKLARCCGPSLRQIGFTTRVWQVQRNVVRTADGSLEIDLQLAPSEFPDIPEQFLVVRS